MRSVLWVAPSILIAVLNGQRSRLASKQQKFADYKESDTPIGYHIGRKATEDLTQLCGLLRTIDNQVASLNPKILTNCLRLTAGEIIGQVKEPVALARFIFEKRAETMASMRGSQSGGEAFLDTGNLNNFTETAAPADVQALVRRLRERGVNLALHGHQDEGQSIGGIPEFPIVSVDMSCFKFGVGDTEANSHLRIRTDGSVSGPAHAKQVR